jgi:hypothetical protein
VLTAINTKSQGEGPITTLLVLAFFPAKFYGMSSYTCVAPAATAGAMCPTVRSVAVLGRVEENAGTEYLQKAINTNMKT